MKAKTLIYCSCVLALSVNFGAKAEPVAKVTEAVNQVDHGSRQSATTPAQVGTPVHDGEYVETGGKSRAELLLPTTAITRLGSYTIFNYSAETNTVDLQAGTVLFCKPKNADQLNIKTAAVLAGVVGTTGFVSIAGGNKTPKTYRFGIIEGHATASAGGRNYQVGPGDILQFTPGGRVFVFAFDVPRFVKSSPLLHKFKSRLPNQSYIDAEVIAYQNDVSRGFIQPPSGAIDYSGDVPVISNPAYDSAQNAQGQSKGGIPPPPPPSPPSTYSSKYGP